MGDDGIVYHTGFGNNPDFLRYRQNLPTTSDRIVSMPNGDTVMITQTGNTPPEVRRIPAQNTVEKGEKSNGISQ